MPFLSYQKQKKEYVTAADVMKKKSNRKPIKGFEFIGEIAGQRLSILLYGLPGSGKSSFALKFADKLAEKHRILYVCAEEGSEAETVKIKLETIEGKNLENIILENTLFIAGLKEIVKKRKVKHVIIDSITYMEFKPVDVKLLKKEVPGILVMVNHSTKEDKYKGDSSVGHEIDIELHAEKDEKTERRTIRTRKNRFGTSGEEYVLYAGKDEPPKLKVVGG